MWWDVWVNKWHELTKRPPTKEEILEYGNGCKEVYDGDLPPKETEELLVTNGSWVAVDVWNGNYRTFTEYGKKHITHWMFLPKPPQKKG